MQTPRHASPRRRVAATAVAVVLLAVTACSGGDPADDAPSPSPTTVTQGPPTTRTEPPATRTPPRDDAGVTSGTAAPTATAAPQPTATAAPAPTATATPTEPEEPAHAFGAYGVSAGHPLAVDIGMRVLEQGGNAVDAAIAVAFAMGVIEPLTSGVGGGGVAVVVPMPGTTDDGEPAKPLSYDYREVVQSSGKVPRSGVGVPGFVAGMAELHGAHGTVPWRDLLRPSIDLAEFGVPTSSFVARELRTTKGQKATKDLPQFLNQAIRPLERDDPLVQTELADTLDTIARGGRWGFYRSHIAEQLAKVGGIDRAGLNAYEVDVRAPVRGVVGDHYVLAAAPALAGVGLVQLLQVAEADGLAKTKAGSAAYVDTLTDAWRVADKTLDTHLGDPNFVDVPVDKLTHQKTNAGLVAAPAPGGEVAAPQPAEGSTTHISVVDADGLTVSMTNTITNFWGSGQEVGGFFVNDHLIRFAVGGKANQPEAGRRPMSYMTPAVVLDVDQRPVLVVGSSGGRRIPNIQASVISRWLVHGESLQDAVSAPRFHLDEGNLYVEKMPGAVTKALSKQGYAVTEALPRWNLFGSVQALELDHERSRVVGATDQRRTGAWDSGPGVRP
ncbi:gamma-glutamyltransferase family protein [Ornithinimicrobium cavernae]|uniref:gamma-glutamyltransferase family protein n=1 Tax=Ornithinimicrobium cavernae TaxID=2666047 RepID=UPI0012B175AC|nr:gamma-glutamyltransferase [Ornithinimicrobium cavernae]